MKRIVVIAAMFAMVMAPLFAGGRGEEAGAAQAAPFVIEVGGSTSVVPVLELLANAFHAENPNIRINIHSTGSSDGIRNAGSLYQLGMTSRDLTPAELGMGLNQQLVAIDGIAVILHPSSPVSDLTVDQIRGIYMGQITNWNQIPGSNKSGSIVVITREEGSGTRGAFEEMVGFAGQLYAGAIEGPSTGAVRTNVAGNVNAIGYISTGSITPEVRAISVGGVEPTTANMIAGDYGIARPFILLYTSLHPASRQFLDWATGSAGQAIVARSWVPIN